MSRPPTAPRPSRSLARPLVVVAACTGATAGAPILANPTRAAPSVAAADRAARSPSPIRSPWSCHATTARTTG